MKLIFENFRKFLSLNEEDFSLNNFDALTFMPVEGYEGSETFASKFKCSNAKIHDLIDSGRIPPLKNNKIIKGMGAGRFGITYLLDNDHVLKLFRESHMGGGGVDLKKFQAMQQRQFAGKSHIGEPSIYEVGKYLDIYYVELGKILPFNQWATKMGYEVEPIESLLTLIDDFFKNEIDPAGMGNKEINKILTQYKKSDPQFWNEINKLPRNIIQNLIFSLAKYYKKTGEASDLSATNIGVIETKNPKNPVKFVFFDI